MDKTLKPLAAVTMVYQDYAMLERWYDYYARQIGPENLFVFSHGNDPRHRQIAAEANVLNAPRDTSMSKFDRRRWRMLSHFASGMLNFYNWAIVSDVDEIVLVDPKSAGSLVALLERKYADAQSAPVSISPFALNLVHVPEQEPEPLERERPILSRRRYYAPSRVYSKPCLVRAPVTFGPGGHRNNLGRRYLSSDLYLLHLKFHDCAAMRERAGWQSEAIRQAATQNQQMAAGHSWNETLAQYEAVRAKTDLGPEDIEVPHIRQAMLRQTEKYKNQFVWGPFENTTLYKIPSRFADLV
jgi:hypothetical protein